VAVETGKKKGRPRIQFESKEMKKKKTKRPKLTQDRTPTPPEISSSDPSSGEPLNSPRRAALANMSAVRFEESSPIQTTTAPSRGRTVTERFYVFPPRSTLKWVVRKSIPFAKLPEWFEFEVCFHDEYNLKI
jgi:hypothetical protein